MDRATRAAMFMTLAILMASGVTAQPIPETVATLGEAMAFFKMPTSFEMKIETDDEGAPDIMVMKMDGTEMLAMRMEMNGDVMLFDMAKKVMYMYDIEDNTAMKMPVDEDDGDAPNLFAFYSEDLKVTGSEVIGGVDCWVLEDIASDNAPDTAWIGKSDGLIHQARDDDDLIKFTYTRINEVPDSEFELPEGVVVEDMGAMMANMGEGVETMACNKLTPNLMVEDVNVTVKFYADVLGFEFVMGVLAEDQGVVMAPPTDQKLVYALMKCGNAELMFQERASLAEQLPELADAVIGGTLTLYIEVGDVEGLFARIKDRVEVIQEPADTFYGMRECYIRDCNGYVLTFAQQL